MTIGQAHAQLPEGGNIVAGAGVIAPSGMNLDITTTTNRAVIDWNKFSIGQGASVNFNQPTADSAVLNRVITSGTLSSIDGSLFSNGNVLLVNPSGVLVGANGVVNTNGFVASTFDISNAKFMAGGNLELSGDSRASIINQGTITTGSGGAHLIASDIHNSGVISSHGGNINLATGGTIQLPNGNSYIQADIQTLHSGISPAASMINNSGTIRVTGALKVGNDVYLVNPGGNIVNTGTIAAQLQKPDAQVAGGNVKLDATGGTASIGGTIDVSGDQGGFVGITGETVELQGSSITATGTTAGGEVLVGGGFHGNDARVANATNVDISSDSVIDVSTSQSGNAGTVAVWSDNVTNFLGTIYANAKGASGDGGFVEVSGKVLNYLGVADLRSVAGKYGTLLLDPDYVIIDTEAAAISIRRAWGLADLDIFATYAVTILADLFPTDMSDQEQNYTSYATRLTIRGKSVDDNPNISIGAEIRDNRRSVLGLTNAFNANGGTFEIAEGGSIRLHGTTHITAGIVDLQGSLTSGNSITINARDSAAGTDTLSVAMGDKASGQLTLSDTTLGNIKSQLTINGGDFDIDFDSSAGFEQVLYVNGANVNIDSYSGSGLLIDGTHLTVTGPVTGSSTSSDSSADGHTFRYRGPDDQTVGLGNVAGTDVHLSDAILEGITGFSHFEIGNKSLTGSSLTAKEADLGHFWNVTLFGSSIDFDTVRVGTNLYLHTLALLVDNLTEKATDTGILSIQTLDNVGHISIGVPIANSLQITRQILTDLGIYDDLSITTGSGSVVVNVDLAGEDDFRNSIHFATDSGALILNQLSTNTSALSLASEFLAFMVQPSEPTLTGNSSGTLSMRRNGSAGTMVFGDTGGTWVLTQEALDAISGFTGLSFTSGTSSNGDILIENADLTGLTDTNSPTSFTGGNVAIGGTEGLTVNGALSIRTNDLAVAGPVTTLATEPVDASLDFGSVSLGVGNFTTGDVQLSQSTLERFSGFAGFAFRAGNTHVNANFDENVSFSTTNSSMFSLDNVTHTESGKSTQINTNSLNYGTNSRITSDGDVSISTRSILNNFSSLVMDRGNIQGTNANGKVDVSSQYSNILLQFLNPNQGTISARADRGSINILSNGTTYFGALTVSDADNSYKGGALETLYIVTSDGDLIFEDEVIANGYLSVNAAGGVRTTKGGILSTPYSSYLENNLIYLFIQTSQGMYHFDESDPGVTSGLRIGSDQVVRVFDFAISNDSWLDASRGTGTLHLADFFVGGNLIVDANAIQTLSAISVSGNNSIAFRGTGDISINNSLATYGTGTITLVAGWDGTTGLYTPFEVTPFLPVANVNPNLSSSFASSYGLGTGELTIGNGSQTTNVYVSSVNGATNVFAKKLNILANSTLGRSAQLGFGDVSFSYSPSGSIAAYITDAIEVTGGSSYDSYALIGHGNALGNIDLGISLSGDVTVRAGNKIELDNGAIGHQLDVGGTYLSSNTYLAVGNGESTTGDETISLKNYSRLTSAPRARGGELRVYGSTRENLSIGDNSLWNGVFGFTFNGDSPLPNQDYELPFLGTYLGTAAQNWSIYYNIVKLSVQALDGSSVYGDTPVNPGMNLLSGQLIGGDTLSSIGLTTSFNVTPTSNAGTYQITIDDSALNSRYRLIDSVIGTFTVNPAPLTITAVDLLKSFRDSVIFTSADWTANGLKNGETIGSVDLSSVGADPHALPGYFAIVASNATPGTFNPTNYAIDYVLGNLLVFPNSGHYNYETWQRHLDAAHSIYALFDRTPSEVSINSTDRVSIASDFN